MDNPQLQPQPQGLVFISIPIVGHLIPMVALAKRLAPRFSITILTMSAPLPSWATASGAYLRSLRSSKDDDDDNKIRFVELPMVDFSIDDAHHAFTTMSRFVDAHKYHVKSAVRDLLVHIPVAGVVTDFVTSMIDVANELGIPAYVYFPSSAACLSVMVYPPLPSQLMDNMVEVVGISPVPAHALPSPMTDPDGYDTFTYHGRRFNEAKGIIVNTFKELEPAVVQAFCSSITSSSRSTADYCGRVALPQVYTVGPVLSLPITPTAEDCSCIHWLDEQPPASVVFLCFGSMGCFEAEQVKEMAVGLEQSEHRFLWVLRSTSVEADLQDVGLPEGFLERARGRGMVWPSWAPQMEILLHKAVGGFVTHCGWNSLLEGVWAGVPMLAWPLYAEQKFNACEMVRDIGVAVGLETTYGDGSGCRLVGAEKVEKGVRSLMGEDDKGRKARLRANEMKEASRRAVRTSGSSTDALEQWIRELIEVPSKENLF